MAEKPLSSSPSQDEKAQQLIDVQVKYPTDSDGADMKELTLKNVSLGETRDEFVQNIRHALGDETAAYLDGRKDIEMAFFARESMDSDEGGTYISYEVVKANKCAEVTYHAMPRGSK
jgi:hypothetical protein